MHHVEAEMKEGAKADGWKEKKRDRRDNERMKRKGEMGGEEVGKLSLTFEWFSVHFCTVSTVAIRKE